MRPFLPDGFQPSWSPVPKAVGDERGVTGLETAIILIAFVVVASVFAFTVLSTGIFSAERGKATVFADLKEVQGTMEPKGGVMANGLTNETLSLANAAWTAGSASTTVTVDTGDKKEGTGSADLLVLTSMTTGLSAYGNPAQPVDLTDQTQVSFWIKSTIATTAGQVELVLDENKNCGSPEAYVDVPALTASAWTKVTAGITQNATTTGVTNANKDAVACVGINVTTDLSVSQNETVNVDQVQAVGLVTSLSITVTNAVEGEAVDLTEPSDSNDDGIADSDGDHVMTVTYTDKNQLIRDLYWTKTFRGNNDSDNLLEAGESVDLTIYLKGLADATPLVNDLTFTIEMKAAIGATVVVQRRTPPIIDTVMPLN